ncbi:MAG: putative sulfate exporter family transporter [Rhodospirillales bacterium]|nr:MAG: putative sulfate exporter family transporter [Rhodospirillales bacterium]
MVYTKKTPWTLILGIIMVAYAWAVQQGMMGEILEYLKTAKFIGKPGHWGEMVMIPYIAGGIAIVVGLWQLLAKPREGNLDYYLSTVGGAAFILVCVFIVKWFVEPIFKIWGAASKKAIGWDWATTLGVNYILLGIILGMIVVNIIKVPAWAENGVRLSRVGLKTGVVLLGVLYSAAELRHLGGLSLTLIGIFVLGSVGMTLWMGRRNKIPNSMGGVLSAGMGVCGVSAAVASAPVVQAKSTEIAYTIGTILLWGVLMMFIFPPVGRALDMGYTQFGAWAGTGILNSAQVAAAALIYQPNGIETLKVAEIFNITRILFLPIIVIWLAVWYVQAEQTGAKVNIGKVAFAKFPLFVLGFIIMFALSTTGVFAPPQHYSGKYFDNSDKVLVKKDAEGKVVSSKLLKDEQVALLTAEAGKLQREDQKKALAGLIDNRKIMTPDDDTALRGVANAKILSKEATTILQNAHKAIYHTAKRVAWFRDLIIWFFAFGLTGLGMQITFASIKQAGGQPLVIGTVVGATKAIGSLIVVVLFVKEII